MKHYQRVHSQRFTNILGLEAGVRDKPMGYQRPVNVLVGEQYLGTTRGNFFRLVCDASAALQYIGCIFALTATASLGRS